DRHQRGERHAQRQVERAQHPLGDVRQPAQDRVHGVASAGVVSLAASTPRNASTPLTAPSTSSKETTGTGSPSGWPSPSCTGSGILPRIQASMILRAIGAAVLEPKPPCSTATATAIVGLSAGA